MAIEEEAVEDAVAVVDKAVEANGISKTTWSNKTSIPIHLCNKINSNSNNNKVFQEHIIATAGRMELVDTRQAFVMLQLRDIVMMRIWKIV